MAIRGYVLILALLPCQVLKRRSGYFVPFFAGRCRVDVKREENDQSIRIPQIKVSQLKNLVVNQTVLEKILIC